MRLSRPCSEVSTRMSDFVDGRSSPDERRGLQEHLRACPDCRRSFEITLRLRQRVRAVPTRLMPEGAAQRASEEAARRRLDSLASLSDGEAAATSGISRIRASWAAAALLLLGLWAGWSVAIVANGDPEEAGRRSQQTGSGTVLVPSDPAAVTEAPKPPGSLRPFHPERRPESIPRARSDDAPLRIHAVPASDGR